MIMLNIGAFVVIVAFAFVVGFALGKKNKKEN